MIAGPGSSCRAACVKNARGSVVAGNIGFARELLGNVAAAAQPQASNANVWFTQGKRPGPRRWLDQPGGTHVCQVCSRHLPTIDAHIPFAGQDALGHGPSLTLQQHPASAWYGWAKARAQGGLITTRQILKALSKSSSGNSVIWYAAGARPGCTLSASRPTIRPRIVGGDFLLDLCVCFWYF